MNVRGRICGAILAIGAILPAPCLRAADGSWLWGASSDRTTYSPPYDPSDAPAIPLLKRSENVSGVGSGGGEKNVGTSAGFRVGDSGTFVGTDGKTYYYRFVEGVRRRAFVENRPDPSSPSGWRKVLRYVDEPRLIKQIWPLETLATSPEPCRPVENVAETTATTENSEPTTSRVGSPSTSYRATARLSIP